MFTMAKWIWLPTQAPDTYADFMQDFTYTGGSAVLRISCDSNYAAYINGRLAAFGQYADYPHYKVGDSVDVTEFVREGENHLAVIVWYYGKYGNGSLFTYAPGTAGLIFEVEADGSLLAASSEDTLSRPDPGYKQGRCVNITSQLGLDFFRDELNADDGFISGNVDGFAKSRIVDITNDVCPRPIKKLILGERQPAKLLRTGVFAYPADSESHLASHNMHFADIGFRKLSQMTDKCRGYCFSDNDPLRVSADRGIFVLIDLMHESVGFLDLDIELAESCRIDIGWGEHLYDGICRTSMRSFAVSIDAKAGRNRYMNPFRRFACRYIQLFIHSKQAVIHYTGIRPTDYPLTIKKLNSGNLLRDTIYKVCTDTLRMCMHEHYEDCPWREQSLYALDSRNQMLCGYYAFGEYEFPRASLLLIGKSVCENGLTSICAPMDGNIYIPSFTLAYFIQMREYIKHSGDTTLAAELYDTLERIMSAFTSRIDDTGLAPSFGGNGVYWNFYEWSPTLTGSLKNAYTGYEAALNLMIALALENFAAICTALEKHERAAELDAIRTKLCRAVDARFWDADAKLMRTTDESTEYSVLVNSLALLTGSIDGRDIGEVLRILTVNGKDENGDALEGIIPNTLSMNCFRFDALLRHDREKYRDVILREIDTDYLMMLRNGATSFWETLQGEADFNEAGSLCHGWAALPIYYYEILK